MKSMPVAATRALWMGLLVLYSSGAPVRADQFGLFTYEVDGATITITGYPKDAVGDVTIPSVIAGLPVTSIGDGAFQDCSALTSVAIPEGVTNIGWHAFYGCISLSTVTIPGGVAQIGGDAFAGCKSLVSVSLSDGLTSIDAGAFQDCSALTSVAIPEGVTNIGWHAFDGCTSLSSVTLPDSLTLLHEGAFQHCTSLTSIFIPEAVPFITIYVFDGCTNLTAIEVAVLNPYYSSLDGVLFDKNRIWLLQCPEGRSGAYAIPEGVAFIGVDAFQDCKRLTSVSIPSSVTSIVHSAFEGCTSLDSVAIPASVTSIGYSAFEGCTSLNSVAIPDNLTTIDSSTFSYCTSLATVTLPDSVTSIGWQAFYNCTGLRSVIFMGDAPNLYNPTNAFANTAPEFTIYYLLGSLGFTSPTWYGYPSVMIDPAVNPAAEWLLGHGLPYDTDLHQDLNGDGVSLLVAYALDLDPNLDLRASLPLPVLGADNLSIFFHGVSPGITYAAETSTDLMNWTTDGVILSPPGPDGQRTASVARDGPVRFLRLSVGD